MFSGTGQKLRRVFQVRIRTQARLREESGSRLKRVDASVVGRCSKLPVSEGGVPAAVSSHGDSGGPMGDLETRKINT